MHVINKNQIEPEDASNAPLFYGGKVTRQPLVGTPDTEQYSFAWVKFYDGAKNHFHTHTLVIRFFLQLMALALLQTNKKKLKCKKAILPLFLQEKYTGMELQTDVIFSIYR